MTGGSSRRRDGWEGSLRTPRGWSFNQGDFVFPGHFTAGAFVHGFSPVPPGFLWACRGNWVSPFPIVEASYVYQYRFFPAFVDAALTLSFSLTLKGSEFAILHLSLVRGWRMPAAICRPGQLSPPPDGETPHGGRALQAAEKPNLVTVLH
jgi:hypothetical protein